MGSYGQTVVHFLISKANYRKLMDRYLKAEKKITLHLRPIALTLTRLSMGIIYLWFGLLKLFGISPAEELVVGATHWIGSRFFVITFLGYWEVAIGICFMFKKLNRLALVLFFLQVPGIFTPLFTNPEDCFTIFPFGLTLEGQYIFKNLVTISAALMLASYIHQSDTNVGGSHLFSSKPPSNKK